MASDLKLEQKRAILLIVDVQERLLAAIPDERRSAVARNVRIMLEGALVLGLPVMVTEQYPKGLGPTIGELKTCLPAKTPVVGKIDFSCCSVPEVAQGLLYFKRRQVIVCGIETHICVYQTCRDLVGAGYKVFVPADAVASRTEDNRQVGLSLIERAGGVVTSTEAALFDLLKRSGSSEFKAISGLVK